MILLKFDGNTITPRPKELSVEWNPVVDGDRNANGDFIGDLVNTKDKLFIVWSALTPSELSTIRGYLSSFFVSVTYINPETNTERTATFYTSPIKQKMYHYNASTGQIEYWENCSLNLIEK